MDWIGRTINKVYSAVRSGMRYFNPLVVPDEDYPDLPEEDKLGILAQEVAEQTGGDPGIKRELASAVRAADREDNVNAFLDEAYLETYGEEAAPEEEARPAEWRAGKMQKTGALRAQEFKTGTEPVLEEYIAAVEGRMREIGRRKLSHVTVPFEDNEGNVVWRSINPSMGSVRAQMESWLRLDDVSGSDALNEGYAPLTNRYKVYWKEGKGLGGLEGAAGGSYKTRLTNLYRLKDYKCADGDCLFAIMREVAAAKPAARNASIRRELGLGAGGVRIQDIDAVAKYFDVGVELYLEDVSVEALFDDDDGANRFIGNVSHRRIMVVEGRTAAAPIARILYEPGHYSHIVEMRPIPKSVVCPVTGDYKATYTRTQLKMRVEQQGRYYHKPKETLKEEKERARANKGVKKHRKMLLVYDFETIWDDARFDELRPYSVAWYAFGVEDKIGPELEPKVSFMYGLDTCVEALLDYIEEAPEDVAYEIVGFNNSRFDNFILARAAQKRESLKSVFIAGGCIRDMWIGRHTTLDIARLCPGGTLKSKCDDFKTNPKKVDGFDHLVPQRAFLEGRLDAWFDANREEAVHYVKTDVLSTADLCLKLAGAIKGLTKMDVLAGGAKTIGGVAWDTFVEQTKTGVPDPASEDVDKFFRKAIVGGRVQNFMGKGYKTRESLRMIDVASLYPTVMYGKNAHLMPSEYMYGRYPTGRPVATAEYRPGLIGFYRVTVKRQPAKNVLPFRREDGRLDWAHEGEFETHTSQCSIELIRRHGGEIDVHEGYYFERSTEKLFRTFLNPIFEEKDRQDALKAANDPAANPSLREVAKLLMNSLSGKTAQRNFEDQAILATGATAQFAAEARMREGTAMWLPLCGDTCIIVGKKPLDKVYNKLRAKPSQLAALIYEYSRAYMYEILLSKYQSMYMDTDSALLSKEEYERFRADYPELDFKAEKRAKELGDLEEELGCPADVTAILLGPKEYLVYVHDEARNARGERILTAKAKIKGLRLTRDRLILPGHEAEVRALTTVERHNAYNSKEHPALGTLKDQATGMFDPITIFERLRTEPKVGVLCSQITRWITNGESSLFGLGQRYLIKELHCRAEPARPIAVMHAPIYRRGDKDERIAADFGGNGKHDLDFALEDVYAE